MNFGSKIVMK